MQIKKEKHLLWQMESGKKLIAVIRTQLKISYKNLLLIVTPKIFTGMLISDKNIILPGCYFLRLSPLR
jgi:hypothetical protein